MKNRGSTLIFRNFVGVPPSNIHTKFESNLCSGSREVEKLKKVQNNDANGHGGGDGGLIARVALTH